MKQQLLASAGSKEALKQQIGKFYYSDPANIKLCSDGSIFNTKMNKKLMTSWEVKKGRYRFLG